MVRFLGGVNFYRDFVPRFSFIASILYKMSQSEKKFKSKSSSNAANEAFEKLKTALTSAPLLAYPDFSLPFTIQCDTSNIAIGAVIGQIINNQFRPVMYGSRYLTSAESRYSATERELLAIVWAAKRFNPYIYGRHVTIVTDHQPLVTMKSLKDPMGRIGRLFHKIQDLDYDLIYQPGSSNYTADLLSRPSIEANSIELRVESCINWPLEQSLDAAVRMAKQRVVNNSSNDDSPQECKSEWDKILQKLCVENDILLYTSDDIARVVVPKQMTPIVLKVHHDLSLAGHRDFEKTYKSISSRYFWFGMHGDVKNYCSSCHLCQTKKHINQSSRAPLKPITVNQTWELIGIDGTGPLPVTPNNNRYILDAVDYFSKFCVAKAVADLTAITTAQFLFDEIVCRFGMPKSLISDHGKNFKSILFAQLCNLCQIKTCNSTFYHPEGNGLVERMNKTIKQILTMYVNASHSNWDTHLQAAVSAYNTAIQDSIQCSPYEVVFGRKPSILADIVLSRPVQVDPKPLAQYLSDIKQSIKETSHHVGEQIAKAQSRQKEYYDRFVKSSHRFKPGDLVRLVNERSLLGQSKSFRIRACGPFKILKQFNDVNFTILSLENNKTQDVHYNRLLPYRARVNSKENEQVHLRSSGRRKPAQVEKYEVDTLIFSQFLLAIQSRWNSVNENASGNVSVEDNVDYQEEAKDTSLESLLSQESNQQIEDVESDDSDSLEIPEKQACPVCKKLFINVNIHIGKSKDEQHIHHKQNLVRERNELLIDSLGSTL